MQPLVVRSLTRDYRLVAEGEASLGPLAALECRPHLPDRDLPLVNVPVACESGFLAMTLPDGQRVKGDAHHIIESWNQFLNRDTGRSHPGTAFVPAGSVIGDGGRILLVTGSPGDRSTLMLDLLARGHRVEGDDHALVDWSSVTMRPRRLHAPADLASRMSHGAYLLEGAPRFSGWHRQVSFAVDPSLPGQPWTITTGPVARLVFVEPNFGGRSVMGRMSPDAALARLLALALMPESQVPIALAKLRGLAVSTPAHALSLGDLDGAYRHLSRLLSGDGNGRRGPVQ
ncbi:hypothetical protein [Phreatobacter sp.]|uniref:hypothetical protein n=1 Tax=Phreatobacter sp. TaxID=1966341 RepID=UPI0022C47E50|nr:hypothetical protein [Phreatobacter sp.]MCZ8314315.1 hypothetical protein [Phreatobacter sp.]